MKDHTPQSYRKEVLEKIAPRADREMNDTRWDGLRRPFVRRLIAGATVALAALTGVAATFESYWLLLSLAVFGVFGFLLSRVNRGFVDFPDELVDERIRMRRNEAFRLAYLGLAACLSVLLIVTILFGDMKSAAWSGPPPMALAFSLFWLAMTLPAAVFAWRETQL